MDDLIPVTMVTAGLFLMWCAVKNRMPHKVLQAVLTGKGWESAPKISEQNDLGSLIPGGGNTPGFLPGPGDLPGVPDWIPNPSPLNPLGSIAL